MSEQPSLTGLLEAVKFYKSEYDLSSLVALECVKIDRKVLTIRNEVIAGLKKERIEYLPSLRTIEKLYDFIHGIFSGSYSIVEDTKEVEEVRLGSTEEYVFVDKNREVIKFSPIILNYIILLHEDDRKDKNLLDTQENKYIIMQAINQSGITISDLEDAIDNALSIYNPDEPTFKESLLYGRGDIESSSAYGRALRYQTTKRLEVERKTALLYVLSTTDQNDEPEERITKALRKIDQTNKLFKELKGYTNSLEYFVLQSDLEKQLFNIGSEEFTNPNSTLDEDARNQVLKDQIEYIRTAIIKNRRWLQKYLNN